MYRTLRLCSNGGGFEAIPDPPRRLDLARVRSALETEGIRVVDARVMLIAGADPEVTISQNGRLLFKTSDSAAADRAFARFLPVVESATRSEH
ncbi:MAG: hypothetical protein L3J92_02375 [Thermoplasmata archaeon]|jgi:hypothetical protein|nr:hypothetical protein [Thermoplasmata archaeon]